MFKLNIIIAASASVVLCQSFIQHSFSDKTAEPGVSFRGSAPSLAFYENKIYLAYAAGDTIYFCSSTDKGKSFSPSIVVSVLSELGVGGGRGPQIAVAKDKLIIAATDKAGNIYTFIKNKNSQQWERGGRINDVPAIAKEGFVSLASNTKGDIYAVWLDLRNNKKNKIAGAKSSDGGKTWSKNKIIYTSPEGTVCECCRPSVEMRNNLVVVMFRNFLKGNRDLFIVRSLDGGLNFGKAEQLGEGNWKLNACPMDGGGLIIDNDNSINSVWRRDKEIYTCEAGKKEKLITTGKQCTIAGENSSRFIAFVNNGKVYCLKPDDSRIELGTGIYPQLIVKDANAFCAWQNDGKFFFAAISK